MGKLTGAEIFIESLYHEKVETIFGYPGGAVLPIYNVLYDAKFEHIMPHHEQGGIHAADGYARSTGKVGVCIATSGPGGTNLVTGLATAYMDSVPIVAFTGQVPRSMLGTDAFQEADITGITTPITKHNYLVQDVKDLGRIIKEAFHIASTGRPGPVLIDIPKDVLLEKCEFLYPKELNLPGYSPNYNGHSMQIKEAAKAINEAQKPVIYSGGGVIISGASDYLRQLAKKGSIPVTTTLTGLGAFDERDDLSLGMLGMHGTTEANLAVSNADLLIAIGSRFDDRVTGKLEKFAAEAKVIHIDIDPAEVGKRVEIDIPIVGDVRRILEKLNPLVEDRSREDWSKQIDNWRKLDDTEVIEKKKLSPKQIIENISDLTQGDALITTEVGQHQMWSAQFYQYTKPRSFMTSGGLGTMGYGFPAAIGVQVGNKDKNVFALAGDGSFQMNSQELATVAKNKLPINIIIFNNGYLGMVRQWQEMFYERRYSSVCLKKQDDCPPGCSSPGDHCPIMIPDFVKLAGAYGIKAKRVSKKEDVRSALEWAINSPEPILLDFIIEEEENVFPMVPPGGSLDKMVLKGDVE
ncbi:biosynthetic-type acetolactate synthase large subunit [Halonatronum saccharophilum]|uniref:biosynthetic-type acetolactate synthase large subunit n=1 Tax=Halonatronum saccharophilum TaxID=150060 RepID=UPI0004B419D3|nr:biosynthetic-type acetolactate synthase large subunit [Halonatronum saccharophilum]